MCANYNDIMRVYKQHGFSSEEEIINFNVNLYLVEEEIKLPKIQQPRPLVGIDPDTLTCVGYYEKVSDAANKYYVATGTLYKAAKNGKSCAGLYWRYL
ncbi:hypothetical protein [Cytobacillus praedii]|uniref:hypothetical protein n=1 Tax=Cytobacillus praedii TaxID=1742358 RepID=UPI002E23D4BA|nr:hypothetical protein [Cytobacillus praedii]